MRTKFTLFLVFLNVALFYTIFYLRTEEQQVSGDANLVLGPEAASLTRISVLTEGAPNLTLARLEGGWALTEPTQWTANDFAVRFILNELNSLRAETSFPVADLKISGQTLADYGLEKPRVTLQLWLEGQELPLTLRLGDTTQGGNRLYLLSTDGLRIHVVGKSLAERLSLGLTELRDENLFTIPVFEAQSLTLETGPNRRTLLRRDGARWNIETLQAPANPVDTELALGALGQLKLLSFIPAETAARLPEVFSAPELRITVEGNGRRQTLLLGAPLPPSTETKLEPGQQLYLARMEGDPARGRTAFSVIVPEPLRQTLLFAQRDLREKRLLDFNIADVSSVQLQNPNQELTLQRLDSNSGGAAWQVVTRSEDQGLTSLPAEAALVEQLLSDLARLSAEEFTHDAPSQVERENYGFTRPVRRITLSFRDRPTHPLVLLLSSGADFRTYAALLGREPVFRVTSEILTQTPVEQAAYRARTLHTAPVGATITHLRLTDLEKAHTTLDLDASALPSDPLAQRLAEVSRLLRAESFLGDFSPSGTWVQGLEVPWSHRLEVTFQPEEAGREAETLSVLLAPRAGGRTWAAGSPANGVTFLLTPDWTEALFAVMSRVWLPEPLPTP